MFRRWPLRPDNKQAPSSKPSQASVKASFVSLHASMALRATAMVDVVAMSSSSSEAVEIKQEEKLTAAEAWARKRADAIAKAQRLRAERLENTLGFVHVDFLDRLGAAEKRDEERNVSKATPTKPPPPKKAKHPSPTMSTKKKLKMSPSAKKATPKKQSTPAVEKKQSTKPSACDPGREIAQHGYESLGPIAAGAFSTILRARVVATGAEVAVKTFDTARCAKAPLLAEARDRELLVLRLLAQQAGSSSSSSGGGATDSSGNGSSSLDGGSGGSSGGSGLHPHIANLLAEHSGPSAAHAVLEYCTGGSLQRHMQLLQKGRAATRGATAGSCAGSANDGVGMSEAQAAQLTWQVASALEHLHSLEVAHRDVKVRTELPLPHRTHRPLPWSYHRPHHTHRQQHRQPTARPLSPRSRATSSLSARLVPTSPYCASSCATSALRSSARTSR